MPFETILTRREEAVAVITLNRPAKLNAQSMQMALEIDQAITDAEQDSDVAAIVLTGAGEKAFSAGADIHEMAATDPDEVIRLRVRRWEVFWHVATCLKPTIGAINGLAYGGGALLASAVDMRVGCERSQFRFLAAQYGQVNSTWTLPHIVGMPRAMELITTARVVEAEEAERIGLLNRLVPAERVVAEAVEMGQTIGRNNARSVQGSKRLIQQYVGLTWEQMFRREAEAIQTDLRPTAPVSEAFKPFFQRND